MSSENTTSPGKIPGKGFAYFGLLVGVSVSIMGNVTVTVLAPNRDADLPEEIMIILAVLWPFWTWLAIEVLTRIDWRVHWSHYLTKAILVGPAGTVGAVASYVHLRHLLKLGGESELIQYVGPLAIDGTLIGCTVALVLVRHGERVREDRGPRRTLAERVAGVRSSLAAVADAVKVPAVQVPAGTDIGAVPVPYLSEVLYGPDPAPETPETRKVPDPTRKVPAQRRTPAQWDPEKAVLRVLEGSGTDAEIAADVSTGDRPLNPKTIQRVRRAVVAVRSNPHAEIPRDWRVSPEVQDIIRREVPKW